MIIGIVSVIVLILIILLLDEPEGHMTEILDDGTVEIIKVN
jgi:NNP family nitrate/nitrite transporter-like MFS transporter